jgi:hypothetical protein
MSTGLLSEQHQRHFEAGRLAGLEVDHRFEFSRPYDGVALEKATGLDADLIVVPDNSIR